MKKMIVLSVAVLAAAVTMAAPYGRGPGGPQGGHHASPAHHHGSAWGHGGRNFWPGFVGGVIGGALARPAPVVVAPAPVVVTPAPVVVTPAPVVAPAPVVVAPVQQVQTVWVEGRYVDQVQSNGTVVRVWQPGHYEQRTVVVQ